MMNTLRLIGIFVVTIFLMNVLVVPVMAQDTGMAELTFNNAQSQMKITGSSTVHDWTCADMTTTGEIGIDAAAVQEGRLSPQGIAGILKEKGSDTPTTTLNVPVKQMHCSKDGMDPKMYKALKAKKHDSIDFDLISAEVDMIEAEKGQLKLSTKGKLSIAGVSRTISLPVTVTPGDSTTIHVKGKKDLKMSQFQIERPTAMWGTIQAYDDVKVHFDMVAELGK